MNCKKVEELLFLYEELAPAEKTRVDAHLKNCVACATILMDVQKQQAVFAKAKIWSPEINDPVAFTDQLMESLPTKTFHTEKKINALSTLFRWSPLQTGLAACSLILAFTFAAEFKRTAQTIQDQPTVKNGVALSTNPEKLIQGKRMRIERFSLERRINQDNTFALSN